MKINILDLPKLISINKMEEVTSPRLFSNKMVYDPDGILSNDIFGISKDDRRSTFAYVKLHQHFIHPHIYANVLKPMYRNIIYLLSGQKYFSVKNGILVEDEKGWTGIVNLYDHWDEINWKETVKKSSNVTDKRLLSDLTKDKIFIDKMIIIPPAYRDVMIAGAQDASDHVSELNTMYTKLIRSVALLQEGGLFARTQYATQMRVEDILVEIFTYFKSLISGKTGLIRHNLIGKSVDYGTRSVISAPPYRNERIEDNIIDIEHTAVPISECCSSFYPFIEAWLRTFFTREVVNNPNLIMYYDTATKKEFTAPIKDPEIQFSDKNIRKMINDYCLNPDNRFKIITVDVSIPGPKKDIIKTAVMMLKGKQILENNAQKVLDRPMTLTDIMYLACVDSCEKRHVMVSRYPVGTDKGIYFNKVRVQSTIDHVHLVFNGKDYPFYPYIDLKVPQDEVGVQFIDTLTFSNSHLDGMGADYDGDTVSLRGIWSDEANDEAEKIMHEKTSALNITGNNSQSVAKEVFNSMYELTKDMPTGETKKAVAAEDVKKYLAIAPDDITRTFLAEQFADLANTINKETGTHKCKYNTWDTITIPAKYFYDSQPVIHTTAGRFIFNKFILQGSGTISIVQFLNKTINKKALGSLDTLIGQLYLEDKINRTAFNSYLDHRDTLGYWLNGMLAHTISEKMAKPLPEIEKKKAELCKKYEKELAAGDLDVMTKISDELVAYAKELLKDDPGMDLYTSGDLDFGNNYKNNSIIKGAVMNQITDQYDFIETSFMDGIDRKDIPAHANSILASQYPASIATADAGYMGKKLLALLQMMEVDEPGTDCGTKRTIPITITNKNKDDVLYMWINEDGSLKQIDRDNIDSYVGKTVHMRTPMTCIGDKICSKCAGQLFYMLGIRNVGLFSVQISHSALNMGLKAKHDSNVEIYKLDPDKLIEDI